MTALSACKCTGSHLHDSVQQPAQHISSFEFSSLHGFQLHDHSIYLGYYAADRVLHPVHTSHQPEKQIALISLIILHAKCVILIESHSVYYVKLKILNWGSNVSDKDGASKWSLTD